MQEKRILLNLGIVMLLKYSLYRYGLFQMPGQH